MLKGTDIQLELRPVSLGRISEVDNKRNGKVNAQRKPQIDAQVDIAQCIHHIIPHPPFWENFLCFDMINYMRNRCPLLIRGGKKW